MKQRLLLLILLTCSVLTSAQTRLDSLFNVLDKAITEQPRYIEIREKRISDLKSRLKQSGITPDETYSLNKQLFLEYKPYICDSAIRYLNLNMDLSEKLNDSDKTTETRLLLSYFLASAGMYKESVDVLEKINRSTLAPQFLVDYYHTYGHVYGELNYYSQDRRNAQKYITISRTYRDSMLNAITPDSEEYLKNKEYHLFSQGKIDEALEINTQRMPDMVMGTPEYALTTYFRSLYYARKGNSEKRQKYLALSAISDIQSAIMDNASLWALADSLYSNGQVDRAYNYIRFSLDNANYFNARLRNSQIYGIQNIINKTYQRKTELQNEKLRNYLILISLLSVLLIVAVLFIYNQVKKVSIARNNLQKMNEELKNINLELTESNLVKEEYIGNTLTMCSTYIQKLESFRKLVHRRVILGQTKELSKLTNPEGWMETELKEFYTNFDNTFLHLYPNFVKEFNTLLQDDARITLKKGELLNTELRIFALVRLGIEDSSKIANFLGYSVNTIYNYRAKVKNKARIAREDFEKQVMKIGGLVDN